jgi:ABC-type proline/glycine betaine transport system ATPase subunit
VLERGKVVQQGTAEELARAPATELVAELLGSV